MDKPDTTVPYVLIVLLTATSRLESDKRKFTWTISWKNDDQSNESLEEVSAILQTIALDVNLQEEGSHLNSFSPRSATILGL